MKPELIMVMQDGSVTYPLKRPLILVRNDLQKVDVIFFAGSRSDADAGRAKTSAPEAVERLGSTDEGSVNWNEDEDESGSRKGATEPMRAKYLWITGRKRIVAS